MKAEETPADGPGLDALDRLHAVYDGRPPRLMRLAALAGGDVVLIRWQEGAEADRLRAQCAGARLAVARLAVARRRRQVPARAALDDAWLCRLTAALASARAQAVAPGRRLPA